MPGQGGRNQKTACPSGKKRQQFEQVASAFDVGQLQHVAFYQCGQIGVEERRSTARRAAYCFREATDDNAVQVIAAAQSGGMVDLGSVPEGSIDESVRRTGGLTL